MDTDKAGGPIFNGWMVQDQVSCELLWWMKYVTVHKRATLRMYLHQYWSIYTKLHALLLMDLCQQTVLRILNQTSVYRINILSSTAGLPIKKYTCFAKSISQWMVFLYFPLFPLQTLILSYQLSNLCNSSRPITTNIEIKHIAQTFRSWQTHKTVRHKDMAITSPPDHDPFLCDWQPLDVLCCL